LSAETLALQAILTNVLSRLRAADPALADAIATGLNDAENARGACSRQSSPGRPGRENGRRLRRRSLGPTTELK
jgi:hypothetical protein